MYLAERTAQLTKSLADPTLRSDRARVEPNVVYLGLTSLITDISAEMVASVLPIYLVFRLQESPLGFGALDGLRQGATAVLALASGLFTDRSRRHKEVATLGYATSALSTLGLLFMGGTWANLAILVVLDRLGKGMRVAPRDALISLSAPREGLARAFGIHRALDTTGSMIGPIVAFALLHFLPNSYDTVFTTSFLVALIGLGVLVTFVHNPRNERGGVASTRVTLRAAAELLRGPRFRTIVLTAAALGLMTVSDGFIYLVMQRRIRFAESSLPLLYVATPAVYMLLAVPMGRLADRIGRRQVFVSGYATLLLLYGCALLPSFGTPQLVLTVVLLGAYYASTDGVLMALVSATLPVELRTSGIAIVSTANNLARLVASLLFGAIWSAYDVNVALGAFAVGLFLVLAWSLKRSS